MTADFLGPVQAMTIAVPTASTQNIISAEAAYMVFGFAAATSANTIAPWSVPGDIYVRFWDSGTLEMIGKAINLAGGKWVNATNASSAQTTGGTGPMQTAIITRGRRWNPRKLDDWHPFDVGAKDRHQGTLAFQGRGPEL